MHIPFYPGEIELDFLTDGGQKGLQHLKQVVFFDTNVPTEQVEELSLHQVDIFDGEPEVLVCPNTAKTGPVAVQGTGIIHVLGG